MVESKVPGTICYRCSTYDVIVVAIKTMTCRLVIPLNFGEVAPGGSVKNVFMKLLITFCQLHYYRIKRKKMW